MAKGTFAGCDYCSNLVYDDDTEEYLCDAVLDEDDVSKMLADREFNCPYFRSDDDYRLSQKQ